MFSLDKCQFMPNFIKHIRKGKAEGSQDGLCFNVRLGRCLRWSAILAGISRMI